MTYTYSLNKNEQKDLKEIESKYYMKPITLRVNNFLDVKNSNTFSIAFNKLHDIIRDAEIDVKKLISDRVKAGEIRNAEQAAKSIVGNIFAFSVIYLFLKNKKIGNIDSHIYITSKPTTRIKNFAQLSTIHIGDQDQQKPDCDLVIYSEQTIQNQEINQENPPKCIILSLKTSLRERAAQTYKWKLLLEIASDSENNIKKKYDINYGGIEVPLICFVTVNFYDEINNPQQRGMLKFFDRAFLAKDIDLTQITSAESNNQSTFIYPLSDIIEFANTKLSLI